MTPAGVKVAAQEVGDRVALVGDDGIGLFQLLQQPEAILQARNGRDSSRASEKASRAVKGYNGDM